MQNKLTNTSRQVCRERVRTGNIAIPHTHMHKQTPQCTFKHKDERNHVWSYKHPSVWVCVCAWEADEGSSLSLGSQRAVMYKAGVDIV